MYELLKRNINSVVAITILIVGLIMALALYMNKTNVILVFGFMLNALLIAWSKK